MNSVQTRGDSNLCCQTQGVYTLYTFIILVASVVDLCAEKHI